MRIKSMHEDENRSRVEKRGRRLQKSWEESADRNIAYTNLRRIYKRTQHIDRKHVKFYKCSDV